MSKLLFVFTFFLSAWAWGQTKPSIVILYTKTGDSVEQFENIYDISKFALSEYNKLNNKELDFNFIEVDDKADPLHAEKELTGIIEKEKPIAIVGPIFSNVGLGLKEFITKQKIPTISIFATHNFLTRNSEYMLRICASNKRLVKTLSSHLTPLIQKNKLEVKSFKDLSDYYSTDLADSFKKFLNESKLSTSEVLFRGASGLKKLKDVNSRAWNPNKNDLLFLATQDIISGEILNSLESRPYAIATIDPVTFFGIVQKTKKKKIHLKMISTSQWLPEKSEYSIEVEKDFKARFKHEMSVASALTFDAMMALLSAFERSEEKKVPLIEVLKDGTNVIGVTGNLAIGPDGERISTEAFIKEEILR